MDPVTLVLVPGLLGGLVLALLFFKLQQHRHGDELPPDAFRNLPISTDVINMAHIRVGGLGGLGLVATALWAAWFVPRIGQTLAVGFVFGVIMAVAMILGRRHSGPMPSSGRRPGANTTLSIDLLPPAVAEQEHESSNSRTHVGAAAPVIS